MQADLAPNRLTHALERRRAEGRPYIDLTESNPTRAGFDYPADLLVPLGDRRGLTYSPQPFGVLEARRAVADDYARRGLAVGAERIVLTASSSDAYSLLFRVLCDPGDRGARAAPELSAVRASGPSRRRDDRPVRPRIPRRLEHRYRKCRARALRQDARAADRDSQQPDGVVREIARAGSPGGDLRRARRRHDRGRGVRRLRDRPGASRSSGRVLDTPGRPGVQSGGAFEIYRFAAGEAGLDWRRRPDDRRRARAGAARVRVRHLFVGLDAGAAGRAGTAGSRRVAAPSRFRRA